SRTALDRRTERRASERPSGARYLGDCHSSWCKSRRPIADARARNMAAATLATGRTTGLFRGSTSRWAGGAEADRRPSGHGVADVERESAERRYWFRHGLGHRGRRAAARPAGGRNVAAGFGVGAPAVRCVAELAGSPRGVLPDRRGRMLTRR